MGALIGSMIFVVSVLRSESDASPEPQGNYRTNKVPLKLFGFISACGLLGMGVGATMDAWEPVAWSSVMGGRADNGGIKLQFSLSF
jgi:hypothetical protein